MTLFSFQDIITSVTGILILLAIMLAIAVIRQENASPLVDARPEIEHLSTQAIALEAEIKSLAAIVIETDTQLARWSGKSATELQTEFASLVAAQSQEQSELKKQIQSVSDARQQLQQISQDPQWGQLKSQIADAEKRLNEIREQQSQLKSGKRVVYHFRNTSSRPWLVEITQATIRVGRAAEKKKPLEFRTVDQFNSFVDSLPVDDRYLVLILKPSGIRNHDLIRDYLDSLDVEIGTELLGEDQTALDPQSGAAFQ